MDKEESDEHEDDSQELSSSELYHDHCLVRAKDEVTLEYANVLLRKICLPPKNSQSKQDLHSLTNILYYLLSLASQINRYGNLNDPWFVWIRSQQVKVLSHQHWRARWASRTEIFRFLISWMLEFYSKCQSLRESFEAKNGTRIEGRVNIPIASWSANWLWSQKIQICCSNLSIPRQGSLRSRKYYHRKTARANLLQLISRSDGTWFAINTPNGVCRQPRLTEQGENSW